MFLQDEEECARISFQRVTNERARAIVAYRCNSTEMPEEEQQHASEMVSKHREQLGWMKIQLAVAEEERDRLRDERHHSESQIKKQNSR